MTLERGYVETRRHEHRFPAYERCNLDARKVREPVTDEPRNRKPRCLWCFGG